MNEIVRTGPSNSQYNYIPDPFAPGSVAVGAPLLMRAVEDVSNKTQTPIEIPLMSAIATASAVAQGLIDVEKPLGGVSPSSLYCWGAGESGIRKTSATSPYIRVFQDLQEYLSEEYKERRFVYETENEIHKIKVKEAKKKIQKLAANGRPSKEAEDDLARLKKEEPPEPKKPQFIHEALTSASFSSALRSGCPFHLIYSTEGESVLKSGILSDIKKWNSFWSGETVRESTIAHGDVEHKGVRVALLIWVQPDVIHKYLEENDVKMRGSGMMSRWLYTHPDGNHGSRFANHFEPNQEGLRAFNDRIGDLASQNFSDYFNRSKKERDVWGFDEEASEYLVRVYNETEFETRDGGRFGRVRDHASKLQDNVCRLASIIQLIEEGVGPISYTSAWAAVQIVYYFSDHYRRDFTPPSQEEKDAEALRQWLYHKVYCRGFRYVRKKYAMQYGPNAIRKEERMGKALLQARQENSADWFNEGGVQSIDCMPDRTFDWAKYQVDIFYPEQVNVVPDVSYNNPIGNRIDPDTFSL